MQITMRRPTPLGNFFLSFRTLSHFPYTNYSFSVIVLMFEYLDRVKMHDLTQKKKLNNKQVLCCFNAALKFILNVATLTIPINHHTKHRNRHSS